MGKIESIKLNQARIGLEDCDISLVVKYKGVYCSEIIIWMLPKNSNFLSMLIAKNKFWAVYDDQAKFLQGWLYQGDLLTTLAHEIEKCANRDDLKKFCLNLEGILAKLTALDV